MIDSQLLLNVKDEESLAALLEKGLDWPVAPEFAFEEYFHGTTGQPAGTEQMAYSATGVLFIDASAAVERLSLLAP